jgi:hypothetical protein
MTQLIPVNALRPWLERGGSAKPLVDAAFLSSIAAQIRRSEEPQKNAGGLRVIPLRERLRSVDVRARSCRSIALAAIAACEGPEPAWRSGPSRRYARFKAT